MFVLLPHLASLSGCLSVTHSEVSGKTNFNYSSAQPYKKQTVKRWKVKGWGTSCFLLLQSRRTSERGCKGPILVQRPKTGKRNADFLLMEHIWQIPWYSVVIIFTNIEGFLLYSIKHNEMTAVLNGAICSTYQMIIHLFIYQVIRYTLLSATSQSRVYPGQVTILWTNTERQINIHVNYV